VNCLSILAWILWLRGYPDQALERVQQALTRAQELAHAFSLSYALVGAAVLRILRREWPGAQEAADALIVLSTEQGFTLRVAQGTAYRGHAFAEQDQEGGAQIRQGLAAARATGAEMDRLHFLVLLAEAYRKEGQTKEGLTALAEAVAVMEKSGGRWWEAELYRLKGELTLRKQFKVQSSEFKVPSTQHPTPSTQAEAEAEACFHKAIDIARKQQAKMWELRATVSLARLWRQQGKRDEARQMLAEIYHWFTEGFNTVDLKEAKGLLEELGH
jgi:predicted ATPase